MADRTKYIVAAYEAERIATALTVAYWTLDVAPETARYQLNDARERYERFAAYIASLEAPAESEHLTIVEVSQ